MHGLDVSANGFLQRISHSVKRWQQLLIIGSGLWLSLMVVLSVQSFVPIGNITRDPATIALHPPYYGALSNLSILLWSASAAVCWLSAALLRVIQPKAEKERFFSVYAALSTALCLDDTYLLHESILPNRLPIISIPETVVVLAYVVTLTVSIVYFRKLLLKTQVWAFVVSLLLFGIAVGVDQLVPETLLSEDSLFLIEDGSKLLAIFFWLAYFVRTSIDLLTAEVSTHV